MSDNSKNPPAFPQAQGFKARDTGNWVGGGMTLRDWFAGQAPKAPGDWYHPNEPAMPFYDASAEEWVAFREEKNDWLLARAVAWRTTYADAMLAARKAGQP